MELYRSANLQSQFRGYDYFKDKRIISFIYVEYSMKLKRNSTTYDITINMEYSKNNLYCG